MDDTFFDRKVVDTTLTNNAHSNIRLSVNDENNLQKQGNDLLE